MPVRYFLRHRKAFTHSSRSSVVAASKSSDRCAETTEKQQSAFLNHPAFFLKIGVLGPSITSVMSATAIPSFSRLREPDAHHTSVRASGVRKTRREWGKPRRPYLRNWRPSCSSRLKASLRSMISRSRLPVIVAAFVQRRPPEGASDVVDASESLSRRTTSAPVVPAAAPPAVEAAPPPVVASGTVAASPAPPAAFGLGSLAASAPPAALSSEEELPVAFTTIVAAEKDAEPPPEALAELSLEPAAAWETTESARARLERAPRVGRAPALLPVASEEEGAGAGEGDTLRGLDATPASLPPSAPEAVLAPSCLGGEEGGSPPFPLPVRPPFPPAPVVLPLLPDACLLPAFPGLLNFRPVGAAPASAPVPVPSPPPPV